MSTDIGTANPQRAELQLAPTNSDGPNFGDLKYGYEQTLAKTQSFADQCRQNFLTRYALWAGQSSDGKKHAREGAKTDPTPWDGASDLRVYEVDGAINRKVALYRMAFKRANIVASPIEGNDYKRARIVSNFMRWLIHTQIPDVDREVELLANYINEKGVGAMGVFWETKQEKTLANVTIPEIQAQFPDIDMMAVLMDDTMSGQLQAIFEEQYGCSSAKAKKMIKELRQTGQTTVATLGKKCSYPVIRAFDLAEQLFIPPDTTDIERAPAIYRVEYYTPEALRAFVHSDGWSSEWVEDAIENARGKMVTLSVSQFMTPINRSFVYQTQIFLENMVGVAYAYQRLSDEDGVPGIYLTVFNPSLPPKEGAHNGYAKFGLLSYAHGQYPFTLFRREFLSRRLHDTRGIPEPGKSWQDAIKAHRDSRIDAASIAIIPPIGFPMGRPPTRWGPGSRIPERRPGEYHFMDKPQGDSLTEQSEMILHEGFKDYCGFQSKDGDAQYVQALTQNEIDKFLTQLAKAFSQTFDLYQQYGDEQVFFKVIGLQQPDLAVFDKGDPSERYNFFLTFDVQSMDMEQMQIKWKAIFDGFQLLNRDGNVNFSAALQKYIESIDPNIAEVVLEPTQVGQARIVEDEQTDLSQIFAGINKDIRPGTPPQLGLQLMQTYMQAPDVQQRYAADEAFRARIDARMKQYQMQGMQLENKQIGRMGALMPGPTMQ